ncbi:MAG: Serine/threonine-protein kinase PknD [Thermoanaerobaculia bacterium]|nr:Serine/threonine-protein kinase PknD [Thermoanaerobaculia bacterium]
MDHLPDLPTGWPADPGVTYDPGRTRQLGQGKSANLTDLRLVPWIIQDPGDLAEGEKSVPAYRLVNVAGEGGFGEVWEAVQTSLGRRVALKRVSRKRTSESGVLSSPTLSRGVFEQEALITARIEHPSIPPVYDLGLDSEGLPVLAMRYLKGRLWTHALQEDFKTLPVPDFLARHLPVLLAVLQAVSYAHSRGVLHRDLKPGQVMLGEYGETWLIDWGLAIRFGATLPADAVERAAWLALPSPETAVSPAGTLAYMAPEQAAASASGVGPWTDIYLAGGILYQLLAGSPPRPGMTSDEVFRQAARGYTVPLEAALGSREAPAELVALSERCLSPDRAARPTATAKLVETIQDYLSGTSRRREAAAILSSLIPRLQRPDPDYGHFTDILSETARAQTLWSSHPAVPEILESTNERFAQLALDNGDLVLARVNASRLADPVKRSRLLERVEAAAGRHRRQALERRAAAASAILLLAVLAVSAIFHARTVRIEKERVEKARQEEARARSRSDSLLDFMLKDLRESLEPIGRLDVLDTVLVRALSELESEPEATQSDSHRFQKARALDEIGHVLRVRGDLAAAERSYSRALEIKKALLSRDASNAEWKRGLAASLQNLGTVEGVRGENRAASARFEDALRVRQELPDAIRQSAEQQVEEASLVLRMGDMYETSGDVEKALQSVRSGLGLIEKALAQEPGNRLWKRDRAAVHSKLGDLLSALGNTGGALAEYATYRDQISALSLEDPKNLQLKRELSVAHNSVGWVYRSLGRYDEALAEIRKQQEIARFLSTQDPENAAWRRDHAQSTAAAARVLKEAGRFREALEEYRIAAREMAEIARRDPSNRSAERDAALVAALMGSVMSRTGATAEASRTLADSVATLSKLVTDEPGNAAWQYGLASAEVWLGQSMAEGGDRTGARVPYARAAERLLPFTKDLERADTRMLATRCVALLHLGQTGEAAPLVEVLKKAGYRDPEFLEALEQKSGAR